MIPKTVKVSELRRNLSAYLAQAYNEPIVIQNKSRGQCIIIGLEDYNRLTVLEDLYKEEDPEGKYKEAFLKEMKGILKNRNDIDSNIKSLKDIC